MPHASALGSAYPEQWIRASVGAGSAVLSLALLVGAGLAGGLGLGVVLVGCAMSEANYYRGIYRIKPPEDA